MCGQVGMILGTLDRAEEELLHLKWEFVLLLLLSEERGPFATGVSWLKRDGNHMIFKRPIRASEFVKDRQFVDLMAEVDGSTTWFAGHTRWPTRGINVQENAHPIRAGACLGTVNGTITNADALFKRFGLQRFAEVDSEIIFRMADDTLRDGRIDIPAFKERLALCRGQISAVLASKLDPTTVVVVKGNMPLEFRYHPGHCAIIYASDPAYLDAALPAQIGWQQVRTKPMSVMAFDCDDLLGFSVEPFKLAGGY